MGQAKGGHMIPGGTYAVLNTPENILRATPGGKHNEILVVGKSGVRTYEGYPATQRIKVCGIYYHFCVDMNRMRQDDIAHRNNRKLIDTLLSVNPNLPVFKQITYVGDAKMGEEEKVRSYLRRF